VLISGEALVPASRFDQASPLGQGYVTYGTDSGHQTRPGEPPQAFAMNDEALVNFAHASYKKVRDVAVAVMKRAYGHPPRKMYFVGSSEGGREGLTMAQRYPRDFDGIFARVPVIHWTALQHAGLRDGLALTDAGWLNPARVKLVHDAVLPRATPRTARPTASSPIRSGCRGRFDVTRLRCGRGGQRQLPHRSADQGVQTLHSSLDMGVELANGQRVYPGRGPSGENTPSFGPTGGWQAWWTGTRPGLPAGAGQRHRLVLRRRRDPVLLRPQPAGGPAQLPHRGPRCAHPRGVGADGFDQPGPVRLPRSGGKLILLENMGDYAQSPYAGILYHETVVQRLGQPAVDSFFKLYTAPNVDHVGTGAPANADLFGALVPGWSRPAPGKLTLVEQECGRRSRSSAAGRCANGRRCRTTAPAT
jgi:feruloyl esterase